MAIVDKTLVIADSVYIEGNTARITNYAAAPCLVGNVMTLHFVKEDGRWLVNEPYVLLKEIILNESNPIPEADSTGR